MRHGFLFLSLSVLLIGVGAGVFTLVNNGEQPEIRKDVFVASVSDEGRVELDGDSQIDEKQGQKREINPQSAPKPIVSQATPTPAISPSATATPEPVPLPLPIPPPSKLTSKISICFLS